MTSPTFPAADEPFLPELVGLTVEEAQALGHTIRVRNRDGEELIGTADIRPGRVNVSTVDGRISHVRNLG